MAINLNLDKYGAQFNAFVNFAQSANDENTLACIGGGALLDPDGKPRTIVAKTDDDRIKSLWKNQFFSRNDNQERLNNAVRDLFKETVFKVCGAKSFRDLPQAVRDVMKEKDYGADGGHPLSVRRILAVTNAIKAIAGEEPVNTTVSMEKASQFVDGAVAYVSNARADYKAMREKCYPVDMLDKFYKLDEKAEVNLTGDQRSMAARLVSTHGAGLVDGTLRILANFTVGAIAGGRYADENALSEAVSSVAGKLRSVRSFGPGDARVAELNTKMENHFQSLFTRTMSNKHSFDSDGFCLLFKTSFDNYSITVDGEKFVIDSDRKQRQPLMEKLGGLVKQPEHRSAITTLITTYVRSFTESILGRKHPDVEGCDDPNIDNAKGRNLLLGYRKDIDCVSRSFADPEFTLTLSDDKKSAVLFLRQSTKFKLHNDKADVFDLDQSVIGRAHLDIKFELDLSDPHDPTLVKTSISQTIDAGEGVPAKAPEEDDNPIIDNNINAGKGGLNDKIEENPDRVSIIEINDNVQDPEDDDPADFYANRGLGNPLEEAHNMGEENDNKIVEDKKPEVKAEDEKKPEIKIVEEKKKVDANPIIEIEDDVHDPEDIDPADFYVDKGQSNPDELFDVLNEANKDIKENDNKIVEDKKPEIKPNDEKKPEIKPVEAKKPEVKANDNIKPEVKPEGEKASPVALVKLYGQKKPHYGNIVLDVATATVNAAKGKVYKDELRAISDEEFYDLREKANEVDVSHILGIVSNDPIKVCWNLVHYREKASAKFDSLYPAEKDKDPPIMREIRRNLFMNLALDHVPTANLSAAAFTLKVNNKRLINVNKEQETLNRLYPGFHLKAKSWDIRTPLKLS